MYNVYGKSKFIENNKKNWRVILTKGGKGLTGVKILGGIFQGDALSTLLFVIVMISFNHILRKSTCRY